MNQRTLTSVVVPTRNSAATLESCLRSIREQTYPAVELIVVDNFSTDATAAIARAFADRFEQIGPERSAQRNHGATIASGQFVLMIDSDMVVSGSVVEECVAAAEEQDFAAIVVPERSVGTGYWAACKALERSCYVGDDTIEAPRFFVRETFLRHGGFDEAMVAGEDWDLGARIGATEPTGRVQAEILHLEGHLRLRDTVAKKYFYGRRLGEYIQRHPDLARRQLTLVRPAFVRHRRRLARRPILAAGMTAMKLTEFAAGGVGLMLARLSRRAASAR